MRFNSLMEFMIFSFLLLSLMEMSNLYEKLIVFSAFMLPVNDLATVLPIKSEERGIDITSMCTTHGAVLLAFSMDLKRTINVGRSHEVGKCYKMRY